MDNSFSFLYKQFHNQTDIKDHAISRLLAVGITTQFTALFLISIHYSLFAANGAGIALFAVIGEVLEILSDSIFMLLLLLLAMGW